jgi:PAS domain S-box-containing protein
MQTVVDLHELVSELGDAVVVCDAHGAITLWNKAAERLFGYTEAEALGSSLDLIIPEKMRGRHWEGYRKTMETGKTRYGADVLQVPAIDKSGNQFSIAFTVALLRSADNEVSGIAALMRDDTKRFQKERAQRKLITDLESKVAAAADNSATY